MTRKVEIEDYYDTSKKAQRAFGKVARLCEMADGATMERLQAAGFVDADAKRQPTIGKWPLALQLDHISGRNVSLENFTVHPRGVSEDSEPLSDHSPISAVVRR